MGVTSTEYEDLDAMQSAFVVDALHLVWCRNAQPVQLAFSAGRSHPSGPRFPPAFA